MDEKHRGPDLCSTPQPEREQRSSLQSADVCGRTGPYFLLELQVAVSFAAPQASLLQVAMEVSKA